MPHPRPAKDHDLPEVQAIATSAYAKYVDRIGREPAPMVADFAGHLARQELWVLPGAAGLLGYVVCWPAPDHLHLDNIAVAHPGTGTGRLLLDWVEDHARASGLPEVRLYTNVAMTENLGLYPHLGYAETHRATQDGFHRVFFAKRLA